MASPFAIFRKYQKTLMVVLVIGSMIAFTGESLFTAAGQNLWLLGALVGTGLALIAGFQFGRPVEYAIGGALIGATLGFVGPKFAGGSGFASELGGFNEERMTKLISSRRVANDFVGECRRRALGFDFGGNPFQFVYPNIERDVIVGEALAAEADEMGIAVDDNAVNAFIDQQTANKLRSKDFIEVRKQLSVNGKPMSESELYDLLRDQIKARLALQTLMPYRDQDSVTPESYWTMYRRMNVRQQLAFTAVPVDSFVDEVGEPSDSDVSELFEKYKATFPNPQTGEPGFFQPLKMKLAYVEADYASIEAGLPEITEEEIKTYYEANKDVQFREVDVPDDPEDDPLDLKSLDDLDKENMEGSEEGTEPEADGNDLKIINDDEKKDAGEEKAGDEKVEGEGGGAGEEKKKEGDDNGCSDWQEEEAAEQQSENAEAGGVTLKLDQESDSPANPPMLVPESPQEPAGADPFVDPPPKYKPLTDVRDQIKDILVRQKASVEIEKLITDALTEMKRLGEARDDIIFELGADLDEAGKKQIAERDVEVCRALKAYADKTDGLVYAETPLATGIELLDRQEYPIGSAMPPGSQFRRGAMNVVQTLFAGGGETALFEAARAELSAFEFDGTTNQYAYWPIGQVKAHEPKLDEPGMREEVAMAWKLDKARPKAEERAKAIMEMVKEKLSEDATMSDILKDVTITGDDDSAKLTTTESLPFTWMKTSSAASPMGMQQEVAQLSQLDGIDGAGNDFMEYVFNGLDLNEVGVTGNSDKSAYYVVQPLNRFPHDESDEESTRERFLATKHFEFNSPMPGLVRQEVFGRQNSEWLKRLEAKYGINWDQ